MFLGGPDFKHFKGAGHKLTSEAILQTFEPILTGKASASAPGKGAGQ